MKKLSSTLLVMSLFGCITVNSYWYGWAGREYYHGVPAAGQIKWDPNYKTSRKEALQQASAWCPSQTIEIIHEDWRADCVLITFNCVPQQ